MEGEWLQAIAQKVLLIFDASFKRISKKNGQHIFPLSSTALKKTSWDFDIHQGDMKTVFRFL